MRIEIKAARIGLTAAACLLAGTFSLAQMLQYPAAEDSNDTSRAQSSPTQAAAALSDKALKGHNLFDHNCAHCHGDDARGDEGPILYNLRKSAARITAIVKGGIKGEMPSFAKKFNDGDIQALIAYLRTLKVRTSR
jgi:mono/diheme cytochrome c family protein